ncbi:OB-fold domain-containing protein [bacterium]|nr:OB-fold domain-containing protein [bacterium]
MSPELTPGPGAGGSLETRLEASICGKCHKQYVPVRAYCSACRGRTERIYVEGRGKLKTFTTLFVTPDGFTPPLVLGICELDSGTRVLGEILDYRLKESLEIDEGVIVSEKDGKYLFRLERGLSA